MNNRHSHIVEVFKTNVLCTEDADKILAELLNNFPRYKINFDLDDCDKILRVQGDNISSAEIEARLTDLGYLCEVLSE
jgi:predicted RNA binding protein with dsRBD fold (UPF0201 family)